MPNIKSAKKRVSVIARRKEENKFVKATMSTMIKNFKNMVAIDVEKAQAMLKDITSYIDSARSKGVIHAKTASRKISRLNLMLNKARTEAGEAKPVEVKKVVVAEEKKEAPAPEKKVATKKTTAKKETVKEPAKKTATKKTATKKATAKKAE